MIETMRSSVNTWECDAMGHMNVRHYFARAADGIARIGVEIGMGPQKLREIGGALRAAEQHVRFHREARPNSAFSITGGVALVSEERLRVYQEMYFVAEPVLMATVVTDVVLTDATTLQKRSWPREVLALAEGLRTEVPAHGMPRGVSAEAPRTPPSYDEGARLIGTYLGPVQREDCDEHGYMLEAAFMARVSDGMAHFFRALRTGKTPPGVGGAALEYRFAFHDRPRLGDVIEVRAGLRDVGKKTIHFCHETFDVERRRCVATSEAVAVSMDLTTRKSIDFPDEIRAHMASRIIPGLRI